MKFPIFMMWVPVGLIAGGLARPVMRTGGYGLIADLAAQGAAVVVVSSDIPEVIGLADRVLVISEGRVVHDGPASGIDEHRVLDLVMEGSAA